MKTNERVQVNSRINGEVARRVRLLEASRRSKTWTQDWILETALRAVVYGESTKDLQKALKEIHAAAKELSFNAPVRQLEREEISLAA